MTIFKSGLLHWFLQRISAFALLCMILLLFNFKNVFISNVLLLTIGFHFKVGLETVMEDYTHNHFFQIFGNGLLRLILIFCTKLIFLLTIF